MLSIHLLKAHIKYKQIILNSLTFDHHLQKYLRIFWLVLIKYQINLLFKTL